MRFFALRCLLLVSFLPAFLSPHDAIGESSWTEVRSPHFRVISDGSARDGRMVANEFEQMRYVFASRFKDPNIELGPPLTIVAARNEETSRSLEPSSRKSTASNIAGGFVRGWEKQFAMIRLDTWRGANQTVVYHEYTHSILHANTHWLPLWLDEGFAEFYAYTHFETDHIYIGAPSLRLRELLNRHLIPVSTMLDLNSRSPYYRDQAQMQLFYAEAWAMVHYMTFGPGMGDGEKFDKFFHMVQDRVDQQKAFQQIFGDPRAFDDDFSKYVRRFTFTAAQLPPDHSYDPKSFSERKLTPAEADYELGCVHIGLHDRAGGRTLMEASLALDPKLAAAHEELGFLDFDEGKDDDAAKEWKQAIALDPSLPRSLFALTMTGPLSGRLGEKSPSQLLAVQATLQHVTQLAPRFAPAFVELALVEWQLGALQQAYNDAHRAEILEPSRAGYRILVGYILLRGKQPALAATYARYIAGHWILSDHDEAVDLWKAVPTNLRGEGEPLALDVPAAVDVVRGRLVDITCSSLPGANKLTVTLMPDTPADAKPLTFTSNGPLSIGFSDTLWWGQDHFSSCHHLAGLPALLAYKPGQPQGAELVYLEVRDNLPENGPARALRNSDQARN